MVRIVLNDYQGNVVLIADRPANARWGLKAVGGCDVAEAVFPFTAFPATAVEMEILVSGELAWCGLLNGVHWNEEDGTLECAGVGYRKRFRDFGPVRRGYRTDDTCETAGEIATAIADMVADQYSELSLFLPITTITHECDLSAGTIDGLRRHEASLLLQWIEFTPDANTVGLWDMNEPAWTVGQPHCLDSSGNGNHMTVTGTGANTFADSWAQRGGDLDGTGRYVRKASFSPAISSGPWTLEAMIFWTDRGNGAYRSLMGTGGYNTDGAYLTLHNSTGYMLLYSKTTNQNVGRKPIANAWTHYAITSDGATYVKLWENGVLIKTINVSANMHGAHVAFGANGIPSDIAAQAKFDQGRLSNVERYTSTFAPIRFPESGTWTENAGDQVNNCSPGLLTVTLAAALPTGCSLKAKLLGPEGQDTGWQTLSGSGTSYTHDFTGTALGHWRAALQVFSGGALNVNTPEVVAVQFLATLSTGSFPLADDIDLWGWATDGALDAEEDALAGIAGTVWGVDELKRIYFQDHPIDPIQVVDWRSLLQKTMERHSDQVVNTLRLFGGPGDTGEVNWWPGDFGAAHNAPAIKQENDGKYNWVLDVVEGMKVITEALNGTEAAPVIGLSASALDGVSLFRVTLPNGALADGHQWVFFRPETSVLFWTMGYTNHKPAIVDGERDMRIATQVTGDPPQKEKLQFAVKIRLVSGPNPATVDARWVTVLYNQDNTEDEQFLFDHPDLTLPQDGSWVQLAGEVEAETLSDPGPVLPVFIVSKNDPATTPATVIEVGYFQCNRGTVLHPYVPGENCFKTYQAAALTGLPAEAQASAAVYGMRLAQESVSLGRQGNADITYAAMDGYAAAFFRYNAVPFWEGEISAPWYIPFKPWAGMLQLVNLPFDLRRYSTDTLGLMAVGAVNYEYSASGLSTTFTLANPGHLLPISGHGWYKSLPPEVTQDGKKRGSNRPNFWSVLGQIALSAAFYWAGATFLGPIGGTISRAISGFLGGLFH